MSVVDLHEMRTAFVSRDGDAPGHIAATCSCGGWSATRLIEGRANTLRNAHRQHQADARAEQQREWRDDAEAWCRRTGHCADCGQPGDWCQCTRPCRCAAVHECGSGVGRDPATVFAGTVEQDGLFEVGP